MFLILKEGIGSIIRMIHNPLLQKKYEIDLSEKDFIKNSTQNIMELSISRAKDGITSRLINTNIAVNENRLSQQQSSTPSKGFSLFGGGGQ